MKEAIAMKCTQEQYERIKGKLPSHEISGSFGKYPYLTNNYGYTLGCIDNYKKYSVCGKIYETWNEQIFLEACEVGYKISKETILKYQMKDEFPELFKLEIGKWYKRKDHLMVWNNGNQTYGFFQHHYGEGFGFSEGTGLQEATEEEVEIALVQEAKKRGYKVGEWIKRDNLTPKETKIGDFNDTGFQFDFTGNLLRFNCYTIFDNGKWADIIQTITKEEAEKQLGCKII